MWYPIDCCTNNVLGIPHKHFPLGPKVWYSVWGAIYGPSGPEAQPKTKNIRNLFVQGAQGKRHFSEARCCLLWELQSRRKRFVQCVEVKRHFSEACCCLLLRFDSSRKLLAQGTEVLGTQALRLQETGRGI